MTHKIGILSDTHNLLRPSVLDILHTCDTIIHCGDFSTPHILSQLSSVAPVYAVRGNTDTDSAFDGIPQELSITLYGVRIFAVHNGQMIRADIRDRDLVLCGHSHKYAHLQKKRAGLAQPWKLRQKTLPASANHGCTDDTGKRKIPS